MDIFLPPITQLQLSGYAFRALSPSRQQSAAYHDVAGTTSQAHRKCQSLSQISRVIRLTRAAPVAASDVIPVQSAAAAPAAAKQIDLQAFALRSRSGIPDKHSPIPEIFRLLTVNKFIYGKHQPIGVNSPTYWPCTNPVFSRSNTGVRRFIIDC